MEEQPQQEPPKKKVRWPFWVLLAISGLLLLATIVIFTFLLSPQPSPSVSHKVTYDAAKTPELSVQTVLENLDHAWDITFLANGTALFTERSGAVSAIKNLARIQLTQIEDVESVGEGGLMGLAVDPDFAANPFIYTCYNTASDIRVVRWKLDSAVSNLSAKYPIVTGMPASAGGRHSGCRMTFGPDGYLWIGTGDAAMGANPQNPKSLGGKILRVDRDGKAAPGNLGAPFDPRIYSYGHRNTQGIAFLQHPRGEITGYSAEHGSSIDDEVNVLKQGNFGWDPDPGYTERNIPMTDKTKFPGAIDASWSSGFPTQAPSGLAEITGEKWQAWNGTLALAMLKAKHLKIFTLDQSGKITNEEKILTDYGRLRDVEQAPDGSLYITTDNGDNKDKILRLTPKT